MKTLSLDFLQRVSHALQEEEIDIYMMMLYCMDCEDMNYFEEKDREQVRKIFKVLTEDTKHHAELLKLILEIGSH